MSIFDFLIYFWLKNEYDQCSLSEIALYFCLLHEANRQHWAMPFRVSTQMLVARLGTSKQNILKARDGLVKHELISFSKGDGKGRPALYTLVFNVSGESSGQSLSLTHPLTQELTPKLTQTVTQELTSAFPLQNIKEEKSIHVENKENSVSPLTFYSKDVLTLSELKEKLLNDVFWQEGLSVRLAGVGINLDSDAIREMIVDFLDELKGRNIIEKEDSDCREHFFNWIKCKFKKNKYYECSKKDNKSGRFEIKANSPEDYKGLC